MIIIDGNKQTVEDRENDHGLANIFEFSGGCPLFEFNLKMKVVSEIMMDLCIEWFLLKTKLVDTLQ